MVNLALKNLFFDRTRLLVTLAGVAFAVMLVLVQLGLFFGLTGNATVTIGNLPADIWITTKNTPNGSRDGPDQDHRCNREIN